MPLRCLSTVISLLLAAMYPAPVSAELPPPPALPAVLLQGAIPPASAGELAATLRALGYSGLLFEGLLPALGEQEATPEDHAWQHEEALREVLPALEANGLARNYLAVELAPDARYFAEDHLQARAVAQTARSGEHCRAAGNLGMALDTRQHAFHYDFRWDGYDLFDTPPPLLEARAAACATALLRAFWTAAPESPVLLLCEDPVRAGPLWWAFFNGSVEALGAAGELRLELVLTLPEGPLDFAGLRHYLDRVNSLILQRLSPTALPIWQERCALAPMLSPGEAGTGGEPPGSPLAPFRIRLASAKVLAPRTVVIQAPEGPWWQAAPRTIPQSSESAPPILELPQWRASTPLDSLERLPAPADPSMSVFRSGASAAVLYWHGLRAPLELDRHHESIVLTPLVEARPQEVFPREGRIVVEEQTGPLLIDRLPLSHLGLAAASMISAPPPGHGDARVEITWALRNTTPLEIEAPLQFWPPPGFSLGYSSEAVHLAPGESIIVKRWMQGAFRVGNAISVQTTLNLPGNVLHLPGLELRPTPRLLWQQWLDGPAVGAVHLPPDPARPPAFVAGGVAGDLRRMEPGGAVPWESRFSAQLIAPPLAGIGRQGVPVVVCFDSRAWMRVLNMQGARLAEARLPQQARVRAATFVEAFDYPYAAVAAALDDGRVVCLATDGTVLWEKRRENPSSGSISLQPEPGTPRLWMAAAGEVSRLEAWDTHGDALWSQPLEEANHPMVLTPGSGHLVAAVENAVEIRDPESGELLSSMRLQRPAPIHLLAHGDSSAAAQVVAAADDQLYAMSTALWPLWTIQLPARATTMRWVGTPAEESVLAVGLADGRLCWYSPSGALLAEDARAAAAVLGLVESGAPGARVLAALAADGGVRTYALDFLAPIHPHRP